MKEKLYYWSKYNSSQEVDFLYQANNEIVPLEVKAEINVKSKSLKTFTEEFGIKHALRASLLPYEEQSWLTNIPLYAL